MEETRAPSTQNGAQPYVLFTLAGGVYALASDVVLHLALPGDVTPIPKSPPYLEGVASIRGRVTPVMNLRARFGFPSIEVDTKSRLIVVAIRGRELALRVDGAREFTKLTEGEIAPLQGVSKDVGGRYVRGTTHLGERVVMVLDPESLIRTEDSSEE